MGKSQRQPHWPQQMLLCAPLAKPTTGYMLHPPMGPPPGSLGSLSVLQEHSRRLWRSQRRKSRSVSRRQGRCSAAIFLAGKCPNLGRDSILCCRKIGEEFPAASKFAGKLFQQGFWTATAFSSFLSIGPLERRSLQWQSLCLPKIVGCL